MIEFDISRGIRSVIIPLLLAVPVSCVSDEIVEDPKPLHCTVLYASDGVSMMGGNNEDWSDPNTMFWLIPSSDGKYGWITEFSAKAG